MIFKSLHNKLLNKKIKKSLDKLSNQRRLKPNPIKTLGCIIDPSFPVSVDNFIDLSNSLGLKEKDLKDVQDFTLNNAYYTPCYFNNTTERSAKTHYGNRWFFPKKSKHYRYQKNSAKKNLLHVVFNCFNQVGFLPRKTTIFCRQSSKMTIS